MTHPIADDFPAIAAAVKAPEADTLESEWALGSIEPALYELRANIGILGHLAMSDNEVTRDEWQYVEGNLINIHRRLEALWLAAFEEWKAQRDERKAERAAHDSALVAAQAQTAAPGSEADIKRAEFLWRTLRNVAKITLERHDEAIPKAKRT
jgi:hypothetical protein